MEIFMEHIDLHTHSTASDGTLSPSQLARYAKEKGISSIALTDHDTIEGIDEFKKECAAIGIEAISGVEISAKYHKEMHILGLFIDENNLEFIEKLRTLKNARYNRNKKLLERINENGFDISVMDVTASSEEKSLRNVGRAHFANVFVKKRYTATVQEAFDKYLSKGKPMYVERTTFSPAESIGFIKKAGGIAVLAHPKYITQDKDELEKLLIELKSYGLDGVESYYSEYTIEFRDVCLELCKKLDLSPTGGSDFHGGNKPHIEIGEVCGGMTIEKNVLDNLKKKLARV